MLSTTAGVAGAAGIRAGISSTATIGTAGIVKTAGIAATDASARGAGTARTAGTNNITGDGYRPPIPERLRVRQVSWPASPGPGKREDDVLSADQEAAVFQHYDLTHEPGTHGERQLACR
ncbi:hypothetical protein GCM10009837_20150 [Streptomyces durmitorensis]